MNGVVKWEGSLVHFPILYSHLFLLKHLLNVTKPRTTGLEGLVQVSYKRNEKAVDLERLSCVILLM